MIVTSNMLLQHIDQTISLVILPFLHVYWRAKIAQIVLLDFLFDDLINYGYVIFLLFRIESQHLTHWGTVSSTFIGAFMYLWASKFQCDYLFFFCSGLRPNITHGGKLSNLLSCVLVFISEQSNFIVNSCHVAQWLNRFHLLPPRCYHYHLGSLHKCTKKEMVP